MYTYKTFEHYKLRFLSIIKYDRKSIISHDKTLFTKIMKNSLKYRMFEHSKCNAKVKIKFDKLISVEILLEIL